MSRLRALSLTLALVAAPAAAEQMHDLKIGTFANGVLSAQKAAQIVASMNDIVQSNPDPKCQGVTFQITRGPEKFATGTPTFVGNGNFRDFRTTGFSINIVSQILECGSFVVGRGQSFGGCTAVGAFPVTLIPSQQHLRAQLWLHELGHSQGLADRCQNRPAGCPDDIGFVMAGALNAANTRIGPSECRAFAGEQNFPIIITEVSGTAPRGDGVEEVLGSDWLHAMPVLTILDFDAGEMDAVRAIVAGRGDGTDLLANAVLALGLAGEERDGDLLLSVLDRPILAGDEIDWAAVDAKLNVPVALGYLINRTQSADLVNLLAPLAVPLENRNLFEGFEDVDASTEYSAALARNVAVGLALSDMTPGRGNASPARDVFDSNFRTPNRAPVLGIDDNFVEGLDELSSDVAEIGLVEVLTRQTQPPK